MHSGMEAAERQRLREGKKNLFLTSEEPVIDSNSWLPEILETHWGLVIGDVSKACWKLTKEAPWDGIICQCMDEKWHTPDVFNVPWGICCLLISSRDGMDKGSNFGIPSWASGSTDGSSDCANPMQTSGNGVEPWWLFSSNPQNQSDWGTFAHWKDHQLVPEIIFKDNLWVWGLHSWNLHRSSLLLEVPMMVRQLQELLFTKCEMESWVMMNWRIHSSLE